MSKWSKPYLRHTDPCLILLLLHDICQELPRHPYWTYRRCIVHDPTNLKPLKAIYFDACENIIESIEIQVKIHNRGRDDTF